MKISRFTRILAVAVAAFAVTNAPQASAALLSDFEGINVPSNVNHPNPANGGTNASAPIYHDVTDQAFATAAPSTLAGSPALRHGDGGFTNGIYAIYSGAVTATGLYTVSADMLVNDTATSDMTAYQIGVIVNGAHRGPNPSSIASASIFGSYSQTLTADVLDATAVETVTTSIFSANAGDSLLIVFSTDVTSGYDGAAGFWNGATVDIDNLTLNTIPEPATFALAGFGLVAIGVAARRRTA
jgi:hypothetical protein